MLLANRSDRNRSRSLRPAVVSLEDRALLNAAMPHLHNPHVSAQVHSVGHLNQHSKPQGPTITPILTIRSGGFTFTNFDGPMAGTNAGAGTNQNGISNSGSSVGFTIDNDGNFHNFIVNPLKSNSATLLNINGSTTAMAFGTNSATRWWAPTATAMRSPSHTAS